jgi:release factor glutamine methyltransferase
LAELTQASGVGVDVSLPALEQARANADALGIGNRVSFAASDWLEAVEGGFDLVVANPPYLSAADMAALSPEVRDHDPRPALDGGPDGLSAYRRIVPSLRKALRPGGFALFEIGPGQAQAVLRLLAEVGLEAVERQQLWRDLAGRARVVGARLRVKAP